MTALPSPPIRSLHRRTGFSLTELLVVIGIIVLLVGLLLVALGGVRDRARGADTLAVMQGFRQAAEAFQMEQRAYPGVVPERILEANPGQLTSTENALLHMMGGYRVLSNNSTAQEQAEFNAYGGQTLNLGDGWSIKVDLNRIGEGPYIDGKPNGPYYTPSGREVGTVTGQVVDDAAPEAQLPELVDSWGQPVLYARRLRTIGRLAGSPTATPLPQFTRAGMDGYLESSALGELSQNQVASNGIGSILTLGNDDDRDKMLAQAIRHPAFGPADDPLDVSAQPRGAVALISAGPDGVYFGRDDGPGSADGLIGDTLSVDDFLGAGPTVFDEFDDIRVFGGS